MSERPALGAGNPGATGVTCCQNSPQALGYSAGWPAEPAIAIEPASPKAAGGTHPGAVPQ